MIKQKKIKITDLSKKLNVSRATLYEIFKKDSLEIDLLYRLSIILDRDLINEYYKFQKNKSKIRSQDTNDLKILGLKCISDFDKENNINRFKIKDSINQIRIYLDNIKDELDKIEEYINNLD